VPKQKKHPQMFFFASFLKKICIIKIKDLSLHQEKQLMTLITMKASAKMTKAILKLVNSWTDKLEECDGRNLNGVAISIVYGEEEALKEAPNGYWDYAEVTIQDVRWDGTRNRFERDVYYVSHKGEISKS
jgi:hypothetical protein